MRAGIVKAFAAVVEVLPQDQEIHGIGGQKRPHRPEKIRIVLRLEAQQDLKPPFELLPQGKHAFDVIVQPGALHPEARFMAVRKRHGYVIGKAEERQPPLHGFFRVFPVRAFGVAAAHGMGMIVGRQLLHETLIVVPQRFQALGIVHLMRLDVFDQQGENHEAAEGQQTGIDGQRLPGQRAV